MTKIVTFIIIMVLSSSCAIQQGIVGRIVFVSGNQMPSPDLPLSTTKNAEKKEVQRELYIYELTNRSEVNLLGNGFFEDIRTKFVKQISTQKDGTFKVELLPGRYSLFVKEGKGFYANLFDGEGNIYPITVKKGQVDTLVFEVNYAAYY